MDIDSIFNKVLAAEGTEKSDHIRDGNYLFAVNTILLKPLNQGPTFIAELKVIESSSKGDVDPVTGAPIIPNPPGSIVGYVQKLEQFKSAPGNMKSFISALVGYNKEVEDTRPADKRIDLGKVMVMLFKGDGPQTQDLRGMLIRGSTYQQATNSGARAGKINTYCRFTHVADQKDADIAKRRAELEK